MNRKTSKRQYITTTIGDRYEQGNAYNSEFKLYEIHQSFTLRVKHLKGSNRPEGWYHYNPMDGGVEVRWLYTDKLGYFAPEISFKPSSSSLKIVLKIGKAIQDIKHDHDVSPDILADKLVASVVESVNDNKEGTYEDYRPLRIQGEPAMMTIARHAL